VARKKFVVSQRTSRDAMGFREAIEVAREALYRSCAEAYWPEMVEVAARGHLRFVQVPGFAFNDFMHGHTRLHD
jgi:hypothetical protein